MLVNKENLLCVSFTPQWADTSQTWSSQKLVRFQDIMWYKQKKRKDKRGFGMYLWIVLTCHSRDLSKQEFATTAGRCSSNDSLWQFLIHCQEGSW